MLPALMILPAWSLPAAGEDSGCFTCTDDWDGVAIHKDKEDSAGKLQGEFHQDWTVGSCAHALGSPHKAYGEFASLTPKVKHAIEANDDAMLLKLLIENPQLKINAERSAIQAIGPTGAVTAHTALPGEKVTSLVQALEEFAQSK